MWIRLRNISLYGYQGVHEYERTAGARFEIDIELRADLSSAATTDSLTDTIDYAALAALVSNCFLAEKNNLLERVAERIIQAIFDTYPRAEEVIIRIRKPGAAVGVVLDTVEVEHHRLRNS